MIETSFVNENNLNLDNAWEYHPDNENKRFYCL